jgi:hypothetical protein
VTAAFVPRLGLKYRMRVAIRRGLGRDVREEAEQTDGRTYEFCLGWHMEDGDPYPGEFAMIPTDKGYPRGAPHWVATGDLELVP